MLLASSGVGAAVVILDPEMAPVSVGFLFPNGQPVLDLLDQVTAGLEGGSPVVGSGPCMEPCIRVFAVYRPQTACIHAAFAWIGPDGRPAAGEVRCGIRRQVL